MSQMSALSVKQPYAEQMMRGDKRVEFRDRPTRKRERIYIYASRTPGPAHEFAKMGLRPGDLPTGVLVGTIVITGCSGVPGHYQWHLADPQRLPQLIAPANRPQPIWFKPFSS